MCTANMCVSVAGHTPLETITSTPNRPIETRTTRVEGTPTASRKTGTACKTVNPFIPLRDFDLWNKHGRSYHPFVTETLKRRRLE